MPSEDLIKEAKDWLASNTNLNMYNQHYRLIRLLMEAAEQERQDMHTELVEALKHAVEIAEAEQTGTWDDLLQYRELLNKATEEG